MNIDVLRGNMFRHEQVMVLQQQVIVGCYMEQWMHSIHFGTIFEAVVFRSKVSRVFI